MRAGSAKSIQSSEWATSTAVALVCPARIRCASSRQDSSARSANGHTVRLSTRLTASFDSSACRVDTSGTPKVQTPMSREQFTDDDAG